MSQALANLHYEMGFFSPFNDQVAMGECAAVESAVHLPGGWLCKDNGDEFIVGDSDYSLLEEAFGDFHEPESLIGLGRQNGIV